MPNPEVMLRARDLSEAILASEEFEAFRAAELEVLNDEHLQHQLEELYEAQMRLRLQEYGTAEEGRELGEVVRRLEQELSNDPTYSAYRATRKRVDAMMGVVLQILSQAIKGEPQEGGCHTGDRVSATCAKCGKTTAPIARLRQLERGRAEA